MNAYGKNDYFCFMYRNLKGQREYIFAQDCPANRQQNHNLNPGQLKSPKHSILTALCCVYTVTGGLKTRDLDDR